METKQSQRCIGKVVCCRSRAYAYRLFKTHKLIPENLLNVDIKDIIVRFLQSTGNIRTSGITAFLELILKPISRLLHKLPRRILSRHPSIHWIPAQLERAPNQN